MEELQDIPVLESVEDEASEVSKKPESFSEVRRKRKRPKVSDMDTEDDGPATQDTGEERLKEAPAKRPVFPPVDASTIVVRKYFKQEYILFSCTVIGAVARELGDLYGWAPLPLPLSPRLYICQGRGLMLKERQDCLSP